LRRRWQLIAGIVAVLALTAWIAWRVAFRDTATPISASQAVAEATAAPESEVPAPSGPPPTTAPEPVEAFVVGNAPGDPGLYVYTTTGGEEIDALGGARHDYPAETFMTIQPGGCGLIQRWTALEERWDEIELCPGEGGLFQARYDAFHKWFGQSDLQEFACDAPAALVVPVDVDASSGFDCTNDERTEVYKVEVIGEEAVTIDGSDVAALHIRVTSVLSRGSQGTSSTDTWYLPGTPLVLRRMATRSSVNDSAIGDVSYNEGYEITLVSLAPAGRTEG
jgi:hypothetical protein